MTTPRDILEFWFAPAAQALWFEKDVAFDDAIRRRFAAAVQAAQMGQLDSWQESPDATLALLLLIDQFARNIHRGAAKAFLGDERARAIADRALARGFDQRLPFHRQRFFYLPFEHSENLADQHRAIELFTRALEQAAPEDREAAIEQLEYAHRHRVVIERFGRFPHRNEALGRPSTADEIAFLKEPGSSF
jgi:uncharacterized protein (DUF924 family)